MAPASARVWALALAACLLVACGACESSAPVRQDEGFEVEQDQARPLFIHPEDLEGLVNQQGAAVLDARGSVAYVAGHIPGAAHAPWDAFTSGMLSGLLSEDLNGLQQRLRQLGVHNDKPVVVYADWDQGWGEEGRIFWMLEYMGHEDVRILYGGMPRWRGGERATESFSADPAPGDFTIRLREDRRATADEVLAAAQAGQGNVVVIDTRREEEFEGATPYGSSRGGHIPTAEHFYWKSSFDADGNLKPAETLRAQLEALGANDDTIVIAYCTGGVRSGFVYLLMRWLDFDSPQNYDGSWWEWAGRDELPISTVDKQ